jgi:hypothetical protein
LLIHEFLKIKLKLEYLIVGSMIVRKPTVVLSEYQFFLRFLLDSSTSFRRFISLRGTFLARTHFLPVGARTQTFIRS